MRARLLDPLLKAISILREQGWWLLIVVILIAGAVSGFAELADEVADGETHAFDRAVMLSMREAGNSDEPLGPDWVELTARDMRAMAADPGTQRWWALMEPMQEKWPTATAEEWWTTMPEVFHHD